MTTRSGLLPGGVLLLLLTGCTGYGRACTLIGVQSGVHVDVTGLPPAVTGEVCLAAGPCVAVPGTGLPLVLATPDVPAPVQVEVHLVGRPAERLAVVLRPAYPNGRDCGSAGSVGTVRLTAGASTTN